MHRDASRLASAQARLLEPPGADQQNVSGGRLIATLMGGLNYQIEHHLFSSMARPYLRRAQVIIAAYCAD
jgi:fatty acid desaturase